jgi:hypothetical protein
MSEFDQLPTKHTHTHTILFIYAVHKCVCTVKPVNWLLRYETESCNVKTLKIVVGTVSEWGRGGVEKVIIDIEMIPSFV